MSAIKWCSILFASSSALTIGLISVPVAASEAKTTDVLLSLRSNKTINEPDRIYFELLLGEKPIGLAVYTLTGRTQKEGGGFSYRVETEVVMPNRVRINGIVTSHLNSNYEPINIEMRRTVTTPDGTAQHTVELTQIDADTVTIRRGIRDGTLSENTVACPDRPFVFAIEFLVQRIDLRRFTKFTLREFDPQKAVAIEQHFVAKSRPDGGINLSSSEDNGDIGYQYSLDSIGKVVSMSEPPLPVTTQRCSRERIEQIRSSLQQK